MIHAGFYGAVMHYLKAVAAAGTDDGSAVVRPRPAITPRRSIPK
jgi:hypothetical protein